MQKGISIKETGKITKNKEKELTCLPVEINIKEIGKMAKKKDLVYILMPAEINMKANL